MQKLEFNVPVLKAKAGISLRWHLPGFTRYRIRLLFHPEAVTTVVNGFAPNS